jgi:hypothetical protein
MAGSATTFLGDSREGAADGFMRATGCGRHVAALAALAAHPLDARVPPVSRHMMFRLRAAGAEFASRVAGITDADVLRAEAAAAVYRYLEDAYETDDRYYADLYRRALEAARES